MHARLHKGQVELLGLSALDVSLPAISFTELGKEGPELLVDFGVRVPQAGFGSLLGRGDKVDKDEILTGRTKSGRIVRSSRIYVDENIPSLC